MIFTPALKLDKYILRVGQIQGVSENIARVRNCPDVTLLNSLFGLCLFVISSFVVVHVFVFVVFVVVV